MYTVYISIYIYKHCRCNKITCVWSTEYAPGNANAQKLKSWVKQDFQFAKHLLARNSMLKFIIGSFFTLFGIDFREFLNHFSNKLIIVK